MSNKQDAMQRTQVYLTTAEYRAVKALAARSGRSFAAVLREAVDHYVTKHHATDVKTAIVQSFGCWAEHDEPDLRAMRNEWEARQTRTP